MKKKEFRTAKETALFLEHCFYRCFGYRTGCAYRLEWIDLKQIAGLHNIANDYLDAINKELKLRNLILTVYNDILIVDKLDHLVGIRKLSSRPVKQQNYYINEYLVSGVMQQVAEDNRVKIVADQAWFI